MRSNTIYKIVLFSSLFIFLSSFIAFACVEDCENQGLFHCDLCDSSHHINIYGWDICLESAEDCVYDGCSISVCGAECESDDDCGEAYIEGSYCYYASCENCVCDYSEDFCPEPGTVENDMCYWGERTCDGSGCGLQVTYMGSSEVCDPESGPENGEEPTPPGPSAPTTGNVVYSCLEDWNCSEWSECVDGEQKRRCIDKNNCGTTLEHTPWETRDCGEVAPPEDGVVTCTEDWECIDWGECIDGIQTRICIDLNNCNTTLNKPEEMQTCEEAPEAGVGITGLLAALVGNPAYLLVLILLILAIITAIVKMMTPEKK